jgi:hypothetical protein
MQVAYLVGKRDRQTDMAGPIRCSSLTLEHGEHLNDEVSVVLNEALCPKDLREDGGIAPRILKHGTIWRSASRSGRFTCGERAPRTNGQGDGWATRAGLDIVVKTKCPDHPVCWWSLY